MAAIVPTDATARPALELFLRSGGVLDSPIVLGKLGSDATAGGDLCVTSNGVRVATLVHYHQPDWGRCHAHAVRCVGPDGENDDDDMLSSSGTRSAMGTVVDWMNAAYIVERQMRVCYSGGALAAAAAAQIARFAPQFGGGIASMRAAMRAHRRARVQRWATATRVATLALRCVVLSAVWPHRAVLDAMLVAGAAGMDRAAALLRAALEATAAGAPFDVKLNEPVARAVGTVALPFCDAYIVALRWLSQRTSAPYVVCAALCIAALGGAPLLASVVLAALRLATLPWRLLCSGYSLLYRRYLGLLHTLAGLVVGLKFNVLRERVDSYVAPTASGLSELLVGTGVFVGLACLFTTLSAFALLLCVVQLVVDSTCCALCHAAAVAVELPAVVRAVAGRALNPRAHPDGVRLRVVRSAAEDEEARARPRAARPALVLRVEGVHTPLCAALSRGARRALARARSHDWLKSLLA